MWLPWLSLCKFVLLSLHLVVFREAAVERVQDLFVLRERVGRWRELYLAHPDEVWQVEGARRWQASHKRRGMNWSLDGVVRVIINAGLHCVSIA